MKRFNHDEKIVDITFDILYTYLWFTNKPIEDQKLKSDTAPNAIEEQLSRCLLGAHKSKMLNVLKNRLYSLLYPV